MAITGWDYRTLGQKPEELTTAAPSLYFAPYSDLLWCESEM
jgi:isocitrate lyase